MSCRQKLLKTLANPNLAYILMMLGIYGLFFELSNPGALVPGILGGICLLLALFAFQTLPVDYTGVALILLGVIMLILEIKVPSFGALSIGGVAALVFGSLMLFDSPEDWARLSLRVLIPTVVGLRGLLRPVRLAGGARPETAADHRVWTPWSAKPAAWSRASRIPPNPARSSATARSGMRGRTCLWPRIPR